MSLSLAFYYEGNHEKALKAVIRPPQKTESRTTEKSADHTVVGTLFWLQGLGYQSVLYRAQPNGNPAFTVRYHHRAGKPGKRRKKYGIASRLFQPGDSAPVAFFPGKRRIQEKVHNGQRQAGPGHQSSQGQYVGIVVQAGCTS